MSKQCVFAALGPELYAELFVLGHAYAQNVRNGHKLGDRTEIVACAHEQGVARHKLFAQLIYAALLDGPAGLYDADLAAQNLDILEQMRGDEYGNAVGFVYLQQKLLNLVLAARVETERRLVEKYNFRPVYKCLCNAKALLHSARELPDRNVFLLKKSDTAQKIFHICRVVVS